MFRNPRENVSPTTRTPMKPSVGRPPTPPTSRSASKKPRSAADFFTPRSSASKPTPSIKSAKARPKGNHSILNFFKKVDPAHGGSDLFLDDARAAEPSPSVDLFAEDENGYDDDVEETRYNEVAGAMKRRKLSVDEQSEAADDAVGTAVPTTTQAKAKAKSNRGPFLDSDSEDEPISRPEPKTLDLGSGLSSIFSPAPAEQAEQDRSDMQNATELPYENDLKRDDSYDDFGSEVPEEGFLEDELRWMQEMEDGSGEGMPPDDMPPDEVMPPNEDIQLDEDMPPDEGIIPRCPVCDGDLQGLQEEEACRHVNACLDGAPIPIPEDPPEPADEVPAEPPPAKLMSLGASRFARSAVPRPGQSNPVMLGASATTAFSMLMSGHAEDAAWSSAAAAEVASRGKPAYQRTCPFYKIMPGFYICVDAFRYGAVQGCNAYFLSHFHSDHYVGLTSNWCHGPIYCSKVTANLVKLQLRVDDQWVVPLDFESRFDIPNTHGVSVTMIPANHCPGSSLFLFEKTIGAGPKPRQQRVLHCGDFRACADHITHPLLMPDVRDAVTGTTRQQQIDVCYLDTTYLNPKYAFPRQDDVVTACAELCVNLDRASDTSDPWAAALGGRGGTSLTKFVQPASKDAAALPPSAAAPGRLLVVCGTYSIGKERLCLGIAQALDCKIWAAPAKRRICAALDDAELMARLTDDPRDAQVHMHMLMELRAETLQEYLDSLQPRFARVVGFRPTGWNYRPPKSRFVESPSLQTVLAGSNWQSGYGVGDMAPGRGSTRTAACFGVPYSEHSSFRELALFCCALRIERIIPTVNVQAAASRARMKAWCDRWIQERRRNGPVRVGDSDGCVRW